MGVEKKSFRGTKNVRKGRPNMVIIARRGPFGTRRGHQTTTTHPCFPMPLPHNSAAFSLPTTPSVSETSPLFASEVNEPNSPLIFQRIRRPSLLSPQSATTDQRLISPLAKSFSLPVTRQASMTPVDERMWSDRSPSTSSDNATPPMHTQSENEGEGQTMKLGPALPMRASPPQADSMLSDSPAHMRRPSLSGPVCSLISKCLIHAKQRDS